MALPSARARRSPAWVRSISRSRSNSATALITPIVSLPVDEVRSTPPSARQWTRTPMRSRSATVLATSLALRPSRSSLVNGPEQTYIEKKGKLQLARSEEHTSELQSLMRISYDVFCLKKKKDN